MTLRLLFHPDDGHDRLLAGQNGGVRGGPAFGGDQGEHLVEVEQGGVGWCEVGGDEHEWMPGVRHAGGRDAEQARDHALGDVVEISGALAEVSTHRRKLVSERGEGIPNCTLGGLASVETGVHLFFKRWVFGHHRLCLEHLLRGASSEFAARLKLTGHRRDRDRNAGLLGLGAKRTGHIGGGG